MKTTKRTSSVKLLKDWPFKAPKPDFDHDRNLPVLGGIWPPGKCPFMRWMYLRYSEKKFYALLKTYTYLKNIPGLPRYNRKASSRGLKARYITAYKRILRRKEFGPTQTIRTAREKLRRENRRPKTNDWFVLQAWALKKVLKKYDYDDFQRFPVWAKEKLIDLAIAPNCSPLKEQIRWEMTRNGWRARQYRRGDWASPFAYGVEVALAARSSLTLEQRALRQGAVLKGAAHAEEVKAKPRGGVEWRGALPEAQRTRREAAAESV
jgi:hypothetical protein